MTKQQNLKCHLTTLCHKITYYNHASSQSSVKNIPMEVKSYLILSSLAGLKVLQGCYGNDNVHVIS